MSRPGTLRRVALALLVLASAARADERAADVDCSIGGRTQAEMNACAAADAQRAQQSLDDLLGALRRKLSPSEWKDLEAVQDQWRRFVDRQCAWEAKFPEGGSIQPMVTAQCRRSATRQRIDGLKYFLCEGAGMTGPCEESKRF